MIEQIKPTIEELLSAEAALIALAKNDDPTYMAAIQEIRGQIEERLRDSLTKLRAAKASLDKLVEDGNTVFTKALANVQREIDELMGGITR
jgi:prefoldin subunit 5